MLPFHLCFLFWFNVCICYFTWNVLFCYLILLNGQLNVIVSSPGLVFFLHPPTLFSMMQMLMSITSTSTFLVLPINFNFKQNNQCQCSSLLHLQHSSRGKNHLAFLSPSPTKYDHLCQPVSFPFLPSIRWSLLVSFTLYPSFPFTLPPLHSHLKPS